MMNCGKPYIEVPSQELPTQVQEPMEKALPDEGHIIRLHGDDE